MDEIEKWLKATGTPDYRLGLLAAANPRAVARIRAGTATKNTYDKLLQYVRDNPDGP